MVDLPTVGNQIVTTTAPQSSVSRGDIQQNADLMAGALNKVADATSDIATKMARDQAANDLQNQKVTLNADGSVSVANPANSLIVGKAGEAYHAAVQAGTIAQHSNVISTEMNDLHQKYETDPAGFKAASDAWKDQYASQHGGGEVGLAITQQADQLQTQHYNAITNVTGKLDLKQQDSSLSAAQTSAHDDVVAMMRGGANYNDPAVQSRIQQFDATTEARAANPLFGYSKEQAQLDRETFHSEATAGKLLFDVDKIYKDQGPNGGKNNAIKAAEDILTNPGYKLSEAQREQYYHKAVGEIRANEAIRKQDIGEARASFSELSMRSAAGARIDSGEVEQVAGAFRAAGDPGGAARVYSSFIRKPLNDDFGRQPLATQTQQLTAIQGANAAAAAHRFFVGRGYTPEVSAGIVGNLVHESGMNPGSVGDGGTSGGLAQFHNERLAALKAYAASQGKPATDFQTQLEFIDKELHTTESGTLAKLQAAKTPEQAAAAFIDYERPQGWTPQNPAGGLGYQSRINLARSVFNGKPGDQSMGPAGSAWLAANRQRSVDDAASTQWKTIMSDYGKEGTKPALKTVNDVVNAARATGNADLLDTISHDAERMDLSGEFGRTSLPDQHAQIGAMTAAGETGNLSPGQAALQKDLQRKNAAITKGLDENPIATSAANFPDKIKPQPPLDFSTDQSLAAGLQARGKIAQFAAQNWQTPPVSALDAADVAQVQSMLANPDPAVKGRVFNGISALPEDVRNATLAKIGSGRPDLMVSVAAGSMMKAAPDVAASIIRGQNLAKVNPEYMPKGTGEEAAFSQEFDKRVPASTFSLAARTDVSGPYVVAQGMVKARYADLSAQSADTTGKLNADRLQQAVDDVTGGILDHNGGKLIAPVRGMPQSVFDRTMAGVTDNDLSGVSTLNGQPVTADYLRNNAKLESVGDGRYYVKLGNDPLRPVYAYQGANTEAPQKFMLDLRNRPLAATTPVAYAAPVLQFAGVTDWTPGIRKPESDQLDGAPRYTDFRKSENVEDRRADYADMAGQWEGIKTDIKNAIMGHPQLDQVPASELAKQLGLEDIKLGGEKDAPLIERAIGYAQDQYSMTKRIAKGFVEAIIEKNKK